MLHKQDSSHLTNIPASPASLHYTVYSGFPQKCSPNFLAPSTNKQNLFLLLFEKWSINLIKTKTSVYSFGGKYLFQKILFFFFFSKRKPIPMPSHPNSVRSRLIQVHPTRRAVPSLRLFV